MVLLFHEQEPYDLPYIKIIHFYTCFTLTFKSICLFVEFFCSSAKLRCLAGRAKAPPAFAGAPALDGFQSGCLQEFPPAGQCLGLAEAC